MAAQLPLWGNPYYCHNCRQFVSCVRRTRRFRLCDACWAAIVPAWTDERIAENSLEQQQVAAYWRWYGEMEKSYPARRSGRGGLRAAASAPAPARSVDSYWPYCECGRERPEYTIAASTTPRSLFGGARAMYCPACEARRSVDNYMGMAAKIHPDWDDETWLDLLYKAMPAAFAPGVLPDYWYELKHRIARAQAAQGEDND